MSSEATTSNNNNNTIAQPAALLSSTNNLNPQAPIFVPTTYKQDFQLKTYADVVNANKEPADVTTDSIYGIEDSTSL